MNILNAVEKAVTLGNKRIHRRNSEDYFETATSASLYNLTLGDIIATDWVLERTNIVLWVVVTQEGTSFKITGPFSSQDDASAYAALNPKSAVTSISHQVE